MRDFFERGFSMAKFRRCAILACEEIRGVINRAFGHSNNVDDDYSVISFDEGL